MRVTKRAKANREIAGQVKGPAPISDAVRILKSFKAPKFDQTVEICVHLGIDPRQSEQQLRGSISMPRGVGRTARVICFCAPDAVAAAKAAGAIEAGGAELVKKIEDGW